LAADNENTHLDDKHWTVMSYLKERGEASAADDGSRRSLAYKKAKRVDGYHSSVNRQLQEVARRLRLTFDEVPTGTTKKKVLRFPDFSLV
jgi:hypothetical protein